MGMGGNKPVNLRFEFNEDEYQEAHEHIVRNMLDSFSKPVVLTALEKQIKRKAILTDCSYAFKCPSCGGLLTLKHNYCNYCGQRLEWNKND